MAISSTPTDYANLCTGRLAAKISTTLSTGVTVTADTFKTPAGTGSATWPTGNQVWKVSRKTRTNTEVEYIGVESLTQSGTAITTGTVIRYLPANGSSLTSQGDGLSFPAGSVVELVWHAWNAEKTAYKDAANTFTGVNTFSSGLIMTATDKAFVPPTVTTTQRDNIASPSNGMIVYNSTTGVMNQYLSGAWTTFATGSVSNAADNTGGKVDIASAAEIAAGTATDATSGAINVIPVSQTAKTSSGVGDENKIPVLSSTGALVSGFIPTSVTSYTVPTGAVMLWSTASAPTGYLLCDGTAVSRSTYATLFGIVSTTYGVGDGSTTFNVPNLTSRIALGAGTASKVWTISAVDTGTEYLTVPSNTSLYTGQAVVYTAASPATGLTSTTTYYVIRISATQVQLATTLAEAIAGTAINLTGAGSGTQTLTQTLTARTVGDIGGEESHALTIAETPAHTHTYAIGSADTNGGMAADGTTNSGNPTTSSSGGSTAHNIMPPFLVLSYIIKT